MKIESADAIVDLVAGAIRAELGRRRSDVKQLAVATGISYSTLNRQISGARTLSLRNAVICASTLDLSLDRLIYDDVTDRVPAAA